MNQIKALSQRTPIYRDAGFCFESIEQAAKTFQEDSVYPQSSSNFIYTRYGNPNVVETEREIAGLESSDWAVLSSSGISAVDIALSIFQEGDKTGTWLFFSELYGGTNDYIDKVLMQRRGISVKRFHLDREAERFDTGKLEGLLDELKPKLLYFEPITNPLLIIVDGKDVIRAAKDRGIRVIVDNTFATSCLWHPLDSGADIVIHSATKYLSGHGNITAGVLCGNDLEIRKQALLYRKFVGSILSPDDAYRLGTQIKTFRLRFQRQCENAHNLARELGSHDAVSAVRYPSLESHATHDEAERTFSGRDFGAMINLELSGGREACDKLVKQLADNISYIPTLGNAESILMHVPTVFGQEKYPFPGMLRLSVGFEPHQELRSCIIGALDSIA